ncbi:MAG: hypothetical protein U9Q77_04250 [Candidatus Marinimicrobia bacterium]|nr:hypothetical protein [Candidatus Neomarinimicrobiota bacterium]
MRHFDELNTTLCALCALREGLFAKASILKEGLSMKIKRGKQLGLFVIILSMFMLIACEPGNQENVDIKTSQQALVEQDEIKEVIKRAEAAEARMAELVSRLENIEDQLGERDQKVSELKQQLVNYKRAITVFVIIVFVLLLIILYSMRENIQSLKSFPMEFTRFGQRLRKATKRSSGRSGRGKEKSGEKIKKAQPGSSRSARKKMSRKPGKTDEPKSKAEPNSTRTSTRKTKDIGKKTVPKPASGKPKK